MEYYKVNLVFHEELQWHGNFKKFSSMTLYDNQRKEFFPTLNTTFSILQNATSFYKIVRKLQSISYSKIFLTSSLSLLRLLFLNIITYFGHNGHAN